MKGRMKWKNRQRELARLRRKHPVLNCGALPDLSRPAISSKYPSLTSTGVSPIYSNRKPPCSPPSHLIVDTLHKQGPMVLSRDELPWAGGKKP
jgi:hypothetical protein